MAYEYIRTDHYDAITDGTRIWPLNGSYIQANSWHRSPIPFLLHWEREAWRGPDQSVYAIEIVEA